MTTVSPPPSLFDDLPDRPGDYRRTDPVTSRKAAAANLSARQTQKKQILARMLHGPVTSHDVADICGGQNGCASKRLGELDKAGLVERCGFEWPAERRGGTPRFRYRLTEAGTRDAALMTEGGQ